MYDSLPGVFGEYQSLSDSVLGKENSQQYAQLQNEIELITAQQENAILQLNEEAYNLRILFLIIVIVPFCVSVCIFQYMCIVLYFNLL